MVTAVVLADVGGAIAAGVFLVLVPLAIIGLVAYGIWELARSSAPQPMTAAVAGGPPPGTVGAAVGASPARALLDERFARGEIDSDEYVARRNLLDGVPVAPAAPTTQEAPVDPWARATTGAAGSGEPSAEVTPEAPAATTDDDG